jgi:hypothetical protein
MSRRQTSRPNVFSRMWSKALASDRRKASSAMRPRVRPRLEYLEDRLVPAVIDVTTTADIPLNQLAPGQVTLRDAIQIANTNGDASNTINLTVAGTYNLSLAGTAGETDNQAGELAIFTNVNANQSGLSLTIQNTSGGSVAINANNQSRVFDINPGNVITNNNAILSAVTINGVTIENGFVTDAANPDGPNASGGGIRDQGPVDLTLNNDVITDNAATADGGGVAMENVVSTKWALTLNSTTVSNNHAGDAGGGVEEDGTGIVNINNSTIANNTCLNQGGGIWLDAIKGGTATLTVTNSIVSGNTAGMLGGGIGNAGNGAVSILNSTIENNFTPGFGGGFSDEPAFDMGNDTDTLAVQNSLFLNNSAGASGGGIDYEGTALTITNSEIKGNAAGVNGGMSIGGMNANSFGKGGGLFINTGTLTLTNSTIADNMTTLGGGGIYFATIGASAIRSTTIVGNTALNNAGGTMGGGIDETIFSPAPTLSLVDDTITGNFASIGGGLFEGAASGLTLQNTILAQNLASTTGPDFDDPNNPTGADLGGNLIGIGNPTIFNSGNTQQGTSTNPLNPLLGLLTNNGGTVAGAAGAQMTVETEAELPGSPAIGKGVNNNIAQDERGFPRTNTFDVGAFQFQNVTLQLHIGVQPVLGLRTTQTAQVTVTNTSGNALPADNTLLTVTASGGLDIGGAQTFTVGPLGAGQSQTFTVNVTATTLGTPTLTASVTSPDATPSSVSTSAAVSVVTLTPPPPPTHTPVGTLSLFAFGLGPTGIDLFEVDQAGDIFALPLGGGSPIFLNSALHLPVAVLQKGQLLAMLAGSNGQEFVIDIINPFLTSVEAAVLAALHL